MATLQQCYVIGPITGGIRSLRAECNATGVRISGISLKNGIVAKPTAEAESLFRSRSASTAVLRVRCMVLETKPTTEKKTLLHDLYEQQRQSPWYDNLSRPVTDLIPYIENGVRGVTSNPTEGNGVEDAYWSLVVKDIQDALELFLPIYEDSKGEDGYVSVEVSPNLAHDTEVTIDAAKWLHKAVNRPNVYSKIPATAKCVPSVKAVIALGISVNVTAVIDAYLEGLAEAAAAGLDLSKISSVASFFVSRVDTLVDKKLETIATEEALALRGKAANAQAALAFKLYQEKFSGPRWEAVAAKGAQKQRLLWASTGVKNPAYPDTRYVSPLIGPDTVNTVPGNALEAFLDHGTVFRSVDADLEGAKPVYDKVEELGVDWAGVGSYSKSRGWHRFQRALMI